MTQYLEWKDEFSVGYEPIDTQHKELIGLINELYGGLMRGDLDGPAVDRLLDRLGQYAESHFAFEEQIFRQCGVAGMDEHAQQHQMMATWVRGLSLSLSKSAEERPQLLLSLLCDWLLNHILKMDREAIPALRQAFG